MMINNVSDLKELSKILNISVTTISRVLNGKGEKYRISNATSKRVTEAAKQYNYVPNKLARGLKTAKSDTIGLIIPDISNPFFADIALSIEKELRIKNYSLLLCDSSDDLQIEKDLVNLLLYSHKVDGIIIAPVGTNCEHIVKGFKSGIPLVVIDRYFPDAELPFITSDNFQGGFDAVQYLINMGHNSIACIQGIPQSQPNRERVLGYKRALEVNGLTIIDEYIVGDSFTIDNGYMQTRLLFALGNQPTAIFALSNLISLGVIKAIKELGLRIPENVSLISFDEQPYSEYLWTPVTTLNQNKREMGRLAVDVLFKYLEKNEYYKKPISIKLKTEIVYRDSVKKN